MQEYVKDFANRIGGRNRGKWRHEDKKGKFTNSETTEYIFSIGRVTKKYMRFLCKMSKKIKVIEMNI